MEVDIRKNGFGLSYGMLFDHEAPDVYSPWFHDWQEQVTSLSTDGSLVLGGAPGAGKSHITQDVYKSLYSNGNPVAMISCHINSGNSVGRAFTSDLFQALGSCPDPTLVIDNLDFMVYTGGAKRRRSDKKVGEYAEFLDNSVRQLRELGCSVMATVHSELWRQNHSSAPRGIWDIYEDLVHDLGGERIFRGEIDYYNAVDILLRRGIQFSKARDIASALEDYNRLVFRQAHHINDETFLQFGIEAAIKEVNDLRDKKIAGAA